MKNKIKKIVLEATFFGVIVISTAALLAKITPVYKSAGIHPFGSVSLAMIKVPVPIHPEMEGRKVQYLVNCTLKNGVLECVEGK